MQPITLSIVGTAGRKDDENKLSLEHFNAMVNVGELLLKSCEKNNYKITTLVSGGASWADHVAVKLYLNNRVSKLRLFLPAEWETCKFKDTGEIDFKNNPGGTANYYHRKFQAATNISSLVEIQMAKDNGAELIEVPKGFYARNALVAKSDFILAMTFGEGDTVKDGGTSNTIQRYHERVSKENIFDKSFHYNLNDGKLYIGCKYQ